MTYRLHSHIRANVVGYVAIFLFAMSGTAAALTGSNTVFSDDIVNGEVKTQDIGNNQVRSADVANDSTGFALTGADISNNTLTGDEVNESTLGQVPSALLGGLGRTGAEGSCDPETTTFVTCASTGVVDVPPGARALVLGRVRAHTEVDADHGRGTCRLGTSSIGAVPNTNFFITSPDNQSDSVGWSGVTPPLPPGPTSFGVDCNQDPASGAIDYDEVSASVVLISGS